MFQKTHFRDIYKCENLATNRLTYVFYPYRILRAGQQIKTVEEMKVKHCFGAS